MKNISVAICDDEEFFRDSLYSLVTACMNENKYTFSIERYTDGEMLLEDVASGDKEYDLFFLDIDMPKMSGMDVAKRLRQKGANGIICFVTSHDRYALDAYKVEALGYVIKPAQYVDVKKLVEKAVIQIFHQYDIKEAEKRFLEINTQKGKTLVDMQNILYIEKRRNQSVIHLEAGEVVCYESLKSLYDRLNQSVFCYAHQGYVVNFDKIKEVLPTFIALGEGREVPVSRKYQKELSERHMNMIYQLQEARRKERMAAETV
ncbi:MAG: response regulator transcription factor [Lachnospiraceae bacterium]|nr:response regulator transcription factor [Lachnospiraceae bacterium]